VDQLLPQAAGVDAATAALSLLVFAIVGVSAFLTAPRDTRARTFLAISACNVLPYVATIQSWRQGAAATWRSWMVAGVLVSVGAGSVALFHFAQVFPRPRPWIGKHGRLLWVAYVVAALVPALLVAMVPPDLLDPSPVFIVVILALGLPWIFGALMVLPFAGLFSLVASHRELRITGSQAERRPTLLILVSQLAGGILAILVIPLLRAVAPGSGLVTIASLLFAASGILMPVAFAIAVWKFRLLHAAP
jgi:hypothetical protein